jgi:hypothetical protein
VTTSPLCQKEERRIQKKKRKREQLKKNKEEFKKKKREGLDSTTLASLIR